MLLMQASESVSSLMASFRAGNSDAGAKLIELFYPELKRMAAARLKTQRQGHSWQPTVLVNELYLELSRVKSLRPSEKEYDDDKAAFMALAGLIMRRLLIHHSRYASQKVEKVPVSELPAWEELRADPDHDLLEVESILQRLEDVDPRVRTVVEMKVFEGCTAEEIANRLGCAAVSVYRDWQFARHWLKTKL
jgi:RNA polymerase sigma factor (TIGR02999 family)